MALNFRALLIPTAAIDSAGRAKPDAVFSVTPLAGGSPVPVYGSAEGGTALDPAQVKTDALGNISGLYVADPGPYVLSFAAGGTVVTSAVLDPRDIATSGDLADALGGASSPTYAYDGDTGLWSVTPGRTPGCAVFRTASDGYSSPVPAGDGQTPAFPLMAELVNADVATMEPTGRLRAAEAGLYLMSIKGTLAYFGDGEATTPETLVSIGVNGPSGGPVATFMNVGVDVMNNDAIEFSVSHPALWGAGNQSDDLHVGLRATTHVWEAQFQLTIVRLD